MHGHRGLLDFSQVNRKMLGLLLITALCLNVGGFSTPDPSGYIAYCPCMGRFGNQADHFLGSLSFAKRINRTLIVPPWITHEYGAARYGNNFVPYDRWFSVDSLREYHRVITMEDFMENLAPSFWPPDQRFVYCHPMAMERSDDKKTCPAKSGNPFKPFWDNFRIDFAVSKPFPEGLSHYDSSQRWLKAFPPDQHPVLALMGAPAPYPVREEDRHLQKYVAFSDSVKDFSDNYIAQHVQRPLAGVHLRNGIDWVRACDRVNGTFDSFMSSPQCVGYDRRNRIALTNEMCLPPPDTIREHVISVLKSSGAKTLFIASDADDMKQSFLEWIRQASLPVKVLKLDENSLIRDLSVLIESDSFIGNCVSSVTAFVVRKRESRGRPSQFFGLFRKTGHSEL